MPKIAFDSANKALSTSDYPKLWLEQGERARVALVETDPHFEFVHTLDMPELDEDGKVKMEWKKRKDGTEFQVPVMEFVNRHICIGDYTALAADGVDPKGCPVCEEATKSDIVAPPKRRFAIHVIKYAVKPGSFEAQVPFSPALQLWVFADTRYNDLTDFASEWGDLRAHDLLLGPCENKGYQKYKIAVAQKAEWMADDSRKALVKELFSQNQCKDPSGLIARKIGKDLIQADLEKVRARNKVAYGGGSVEDYTPAVPADPDGESDGPYTGPPIDLGGILDGSSEPTPDLAEVVAAEASAGGSADLSDLLEGL